ncbi:hypothetical protein [Shewanella pneumatophori]|uniref:Uncharacterized protein n=1 Tax=Shewanella pneumatophori TaxID=314092 RepID=A0A9X1ZII4_9GAMM|nr:hypothetical protein [Shewanella pneumatophori]MCL1138418.1 hypothetical protein [Shewanella pneumatophori]
MLFIGGFFLSPMQAAASEQNQNQQQIVTSTELQQSNHYSNDLRRVTTELASKGLPVTLKEHPAKQSSGNDSEYIQAVSQRFISFSQHDPQQSRPQYELAFEFSSPPVPSFAIGYRVDVKPAADWVLHVNSCAHRLAAWKESNLLYRFSQARA